MEKVDLKKETAKPQNGSKRNQKEEKSKSRPIFKWFYMCINM